MPSVYDGITILKETKNPNTDSTWQSVFRPNDNIKIYHDYNNNGSIINSRKGETVFIIGRGPSLGKVLENQELKELLLNDKVTKYCINDSIDVLEGNCHYWSACDRLSKFSMDVHDNDKVLKLIPVSRVKEERRRNKKLNLSKTIGIQTCLVDDVISKKINFVDAFCNSIPIIYGYKKGHKSTFLYTIKASMLMGFKRLAFIGVDFKMDIKNPYYGVKKGKYAKYHINHNSSLFNFLIPIVKGIQENISPSIAMCSVNNIQAMPFIETVEIKKILEEEIAAKS